MFGSLSRKWAFSAAVATAALVSANVAEAQFYSSPDVCNPCMQSYAPPVAMATNPCPCVQPVQQMVYREVPVTKYRTVQKTEKVPVMKVVYEDRKVTAYKQEVEARTVNVPATTYQTITECRPVTQNRSYWRTVQQPVPKPTACQYDSRPTFMGWMNRNMYSMRSAMTPNSIQRREFVPNVVTRNVPYQRVVAVPTTRQVTYNVAKMVPYETTEKVAVQKIEYEDRAVTAYEPYTTMETVAVGSTTTYAYVDPYGSSATTANRSASLEPTPATSALPIAPRAAEAPATRPPAAPADESGSLFTPLSYPRVVPQNPTPAPAGYYDAHRQVQPQPTSTVPSAVKVAGWRKANVAPETIVSEPTQMVIRSRQAVPAPGAEIKIVAAKR